MKENKETIEFLKEQLERTNYWISFAEAKNGAIVAINIALMTIIVDLFSYAAELCVFALSCLIVSNLICLISFFPNLKTHWKKEDDKGNIDKEKLSGEKSAKNDDSELNLLFYSDIAKLSEEQYKEQVRIKYGEQFGEKCFNNKIAFDYLSEIHINSCIANRKYILFKYAIKSDIFALVLCIIIFIVA